MNMKERVAVYGGIAVAIALAAGYRGPGNLATAGELPNARSADMKIGSCDVLSISLKLVQSEKYTAIMASLSEGLKKQLQPKREEIDALRLKLQALPQDGPEFKAGVGVFQQKSQALEEDGKQAQRSINEQQVKNLFEVYDAVTAAANSVGSKLGYTHILASRPPGKSPELGLDPLIEITLHPLIKGGVGADITAEVIKELKLDIAPSAGPAIVPAPPATPVPTPDKK